MTSLRELVEAATPGPWTWGPGAGLTVEDEATHHLIALVPELAAVALAAERVESAVTDLLDWAERYRGGDTTITSEHYYICRDEARIARRIYLEASEALRARLTPEAK